MLSRQQLPESRKPDLPFRENPTLDIAARFPVVDNVPLSDADRPHFRRDTISLTCNRYAIRNVLLRESSS
jgi:hypothetical protein